MSSLVTATPSRASSLVNLSFNRLDLPVPIRAHWCSVLYTLCTLSTETHFQIHMHTFEFVNLAFECLAYLHNNV